MNIKALRKELDELREQAGIYQPVYCSEEDNAMFKMLLQDKKPLPEGVYVYEGKFFTYMESDLSEQEFDELLTLRKDKYLKSIDKRLAEQDEHLSSIKSGVNFIVVVIFISIVLFIVGLFANG